MNSAWPHGRAIQGLYLITPDIHDTMQLLERVRAVIGQAALLQYRNKRADQQLRREQVAALLPVCHAAGVPLIVNDDWQLAKALGADGAHLGQEDGALPAARTLLGDAAILGATCHGDIALAQAAASGGASYLAFGAFVPSPSTPQARLAALDVLRASARFGLPRVAIGGITPDNAPRLVAAGADLLAVISGVFDAPDPIAAARAYRACFIHPHPILPPQAEEGDKETSA